MTIDIMIITADATRNVAHEIDGQLIDRLADKGLLILDGDSFARLMDLAGLTCLEIKVGPSDATLTYDLRKRDGETNGTS